MYFIINRDVDDVQDMMDDITEQNEIAQEIGDALSAPVGFNQDLDEVYNIGFLVFAKPSKHCMHM